MADLTPVQEEQERRRRLKAQEQAAVLSYYPVVFATPEGQAVLADLRASAFYATTTLQIGADGHIDPLVTIGNERVRQFVLALDANIRKGARPPVEPQRQAVTGQEG